MQIAIITMARKGSKRCPDKIRRTFRGKPLYEWTVDAALRLGSPYYFFHDYDDLALPEDVIEIHRLPEFAGDTHRTCEEIKWAKIDAEIYIFLQCTSPIRDVDLLQSYISFFAVSGYDAGFCARRMKSAFYYNRKEGYQSYSTERVNYAMNDRTDNGCERSILYKETGSFYIFRRKMLDEKHILATENYFIFDDLYDIDIDTEEDIENANHC